MSCSVRNSAVIASVPRVRGFSAAATDAIALTRLHEYGASPAMPPRLKPINTTTSAPKRMSRSSPDDRKYSGIRTTMSAPITAPGRLPRPPITTMIRISIDLLKVKSLGLR